MAIYHLSMQIIGRSDGRSSTAAAAYRAGCRITDFRTGEVHDFTRKRGVLGSFILAPATAPAWMSERSALWNGVEKAEDELNRKRNFAQLAREMELSLPHELSHKQREQLLKEFIHEEFVSLGMVADVAIHEPSADGDSRNFHAHVMFTMRLIDDNGFGEKEREWNQKKQLEHWRASWERRLNLALETEGVEVRVNHRSYKRQALAAGHDMAFAPLPTVHLGPKASAMERDGIRTIPGDLNREVSELNREVKIVNLELERARRQAKWVAESPVAHLPAPFMRSPRTLPIADQTPQSENRPAAPLMRLPTFPKSRPEAPNPSMAFAHHLARLRATPVSALKAKVRVSGTTTSRSWSDADRQAWRRRLVERHYQVEIQDSLAALLSFVDRQSVQNGLRLKLAGGGQLDDLGDQIQASGQDLRVECRATVALCKAKGWSAIVSSGPPEYLAMMREEAERAGLQFNEPGAPAAEPELRDDDEPRPGPR